MERLSVMLAEKIILICKDCIKTFAEKDVSVILSTGKVNPIQLGKIPSNIYVYSFVPQLEVLQNADLFITHGGMNSVLDEETVKELKFGFEHEK